MNNYTNSNVIERPQRCAETGDRIFTNVIKLPFEDSGISHSIIRLANCHMGSQKILRRTPLLIKNTSNQKSTIRYAMGNGGSVSGLTKHSIAIDYDAAYELGVDFKHREHLIVRKATLLESIKWLMSSPDLNVRLNTRIAMLSAALAIYSVVLTISTMML